MNAERAISVLCVDDHEIVRDGISFALQAQKDMVLAAQASNGIEAVAAYRQHRPDVTLMDLQMPRMNGIEAIRIIREEFPCARIVVLTTYSGDIQAARALSAGAAGFILKSMLRTELIDTIRAVHAGRRKITQEIATQLAEHVGADDLTDREIEVLRSVHSGCSNKTVADRLRVTEDTIKGHMKNVLAKLQANDRTHAVAIALKRGYLDG